MIKASEIRKSTHVKQVQNPKFVIDFAADLVHGVAGEVDVGLAKISTGSRNILLVLSLVKRRPRKMAFTHNRKEEDTTSKKEAAEREKGAESIGEEKYVIKVKRERKPVRRLKVMLC